jgi:hypothetical protein
MASTIGQSRAFEVKAVADVAMVLVQDLFRGLPQINIEVSPRNRVVLAEFNASIEFFDGFMRLSQELRLTAAQALLRPQWEAFVRGLWLRFGATDQQIQDASGGQDFNFPRMEALIDVVPDGIQALLRDHKDRNWRRYCDYTHTGPISLSRWSSPDCFEPHFPLEETLLDLRQACVYGVHAPRCVGWMGAHEAMAHHFDECLHRFLSSAVVDQAANAAPNQEQGTPGQT